MVRERVSFVIMIASPKHSEQFPQKVGLHLARSNVK